MAEPLACSVAFASLELLTSSEASAAEDPRLSGSSGRVGSWRENVARIANGACVEGLAPARDQPGVLDVRVLGAIGVVQLDHAVDVAAATAIAADRGVWLRPFRDLIYTMPPYVTDDDDLARVAGAWSPGRAAAA